MIAPGIVASDFKDGIYWINKTGSFSESIRANLVDIAVDSNQNVYTIATTLNKVSLIKYDSNGVLLWQIRLGDGTNRHFANGISVSPNGDIFITGRFSTTTSELPSEIFTARVDPDGNVLWNKRFNTRASSINSEGKVVSGFNANGFSYSITAGTGGGKIRLIKHNELGDIVFQKSLSSPSANSSVGDTVSDIVQDLAGNIYICGRYRDNVNEQYYVYIIKLDSNLDIIWQKIISASATSKVTALSDPKMDINLTNNEIFIAYYALFTYPPTATVSTDRNYTVFRISETGSIIAQSLGYTGIYTGSNLITGLKVSDTVNSNVYLCLQAKTASSPFGVQYFRLNNILVSNSSFKMPSTSELSTSTIEIDSFDNVYFAGDFDISFNKDKSAVISVNGKLPSNLSSKLGSYVIDYAGSSNDLNITLESTSSFFGIPDIPSRYAAQIIPGDMIILDTTFGSSDSLMTLTSSTYSFTQRSFE